jgi:hypothetical protein
MITPLEITKDELVSEPEIRNLATGKSIIAFNLKISERTINLNTGQKLHYQNGLYEIMNREPVQSTIDYLKFNCYLKALDTPSEDS